ncbi:hypothetical protein MBLNU457_6180t2 [Dothideomycetes sp. NU457]
MPTAYTTAQKSAIQQYAALTQVDARSAAKVLKHHNWNLESAANARPCLSTSKRSESHKLCADDITDLPTDSFFSGGANNASNPHVATLNKLFDSHRDNPQHEPDEIGMDGMSQIMGEMDISLESVGLLVFSELVQSPSLGKITRDGFVNGLSGENVSDLSKTRNIVLKRQAQLPQESGRATFRSIYKHTFVIARPQGQKAVPLEAAIEYWKVLFSEPSLAWATANTPWLDWWIEFLNDRWKKSVNKDMWDQTLSFAQKTLEDDSLKWWSEDSAWPGVIDEFVEYAQKEKRGGEAMDTS